MDPSVSQANEGRAQPIDRTLIGLRTGDVEDSVRRGCLTWPAVRSMGNEARKQGKWCRPCRVMGCCGSMHAASRFVGAPDPHGPNAVCIA